MKMKVYKSNYKTPKFLLLPLGEEDILTTSGVHSPTVDEDADEETYLRSAE